MPKPLTVWITINWKILKEMSIPDHPTCLLRNLYAGQEATVITGHGTTVWFQIGKGVVKAVYCYPAYLTYVQSTSRETLGWKMHKLESRLPGEMSGAAGMCPDRDKVTGRERNLQGSSSPRGCPGGPICPLSLSVLLLLGFLLLGNVTYGDQASPEKSNPTKKDPPRLRPTLPPGHWEPYDQPGMKGLLRFVTDHPPHKWCCAWKGIRNAHDCFDPGHDHKHRTKPKRKRPQA